MTRIEFSGGGSAFSVAFAALVAAFALLVPSVPSASADFTVCVPGGEAGQCKADGVAADFETGRLYVADAGNNRVDVFEPDGDFLVAFGWGVDTGAAQFETCDTASGCQAGIAGSGDGQFNKPRRIAVDNDPASSAQHDVYVYDSNNLRVQRFHPDGAFVDKTEPPVVFNDTINLIATGPGGVVYVGDVIDFDKETIIKRFNADLEQIGECSLAHKDRLNRGLAVDSAGNIYAAFNNGGGIFKFKPDCSEFGSPYPLEPTVGTSALAVDAADSLYAARAVRKVGPGSFRAVNKYTSAGTILRRYGYGTLLDGVPGLAPLATAFGDIFASEDSGFVKYLSEPPPGPVIASVEADPGNVSASLEAEVNPEGKATEYEFEYVDDATFQTEGFTSAESTPLTALPGSPDFELHPASAEIGCEEASEEAIENGECLTPETLYHFRIKATNADGEGNSPVEGTLETAPPLEIDAFAGEAGPDSARLTAEVDPLGLPTTGWLEYVDEATYQESGFADAIQVPDVAGGAGPLDFGSGDGFVKRSVFVELVPGTTYRFRAAATNPLLAQPVFSAERVFTTFNEEEAESCPANEAFRKGPAALLADCRAYEMVSPLDKEGGDIATLREATELLPAVLNQSSLSGDKLAYGSYRAFGDSKSAPYTSQYVAVRTKAGWRSHFTLGPRGKALTVSIQNELRMLSLDLCQAWFRTTSDPVLAPKAIPGKANLYRRLDQECDEERYEAISTATPTQSLGPLEFQGASADGGESIYVATDNLTPDAPDLDGKGLALYYQTEGEGQPDFVCIGTDGKAITGTCGGGTSADQVGRGRSASLHNAISAAGDRVFWSTEGGAGTGQVFVRLRPDKAQSAISAGKCTQPTRACTIAVSAKGEELSGATESMFWWAADDGSRALYTTSNGDLYRFEVDTETTTPIASDVIGVMGASEDAKRLYFASTEALPTGPNSEGDEPVAGEPNLYFHDEVGDTDFVARLVKASDVTSLHAAINVAPYKRAARVSPDGLAAAFMSTGRQTGYDNKDGKTGDLATEVFHYDAAANGGEGELSCASCNPSGARPASLIVTRGNDQFRGAGWLPPWSKSLYPGRPLADDGGRLFFEAGDALAPRDANGAQDVYQWEAAGQGGCDESDAAYSPQNEGCITLISSGQSAGAATFMDASPTGDDVFFTTAAGLVPEDYGLIDAYDARVDGGLPFPPVPEGGCEGEACQNPAAAPGLPPGPGLTYQGPGDVSDPPAKSRCRKGKIRRRGRCVKRRGRARGAHAKRRRGSGR